MKRRLSYYTVKGNVDQLFSELVEYDKVSEKNKLMPPFIQQEGTKYAYSPIDTRNPKELNKLAEKREADYLEQHPDNTEELFIEVEIERAIEYQTYFKDYKSDKEHKEYYYALQRWIECLQSNFGRIYLFKGGKQVSSSWDFWERTGEIERAKKKGITINPTHNLKLLKPTRQGLFEKAKQDFIDERIFKKVDTSDFDLALLHYAWLKKELLVIEQWLSDTYPNGDKKKIPSTSDQIEILKYKRFVVDEMTQTENAINPAHPLEPKQESETIEIRPALNPETLEIVFEIFKPFFDSEQHDELKGAMRTGDNTSQKLLFKDNGNRFTDTYKKLIEQGFITGCQKQDLIKWIVSSFAFVHNKKVKPFIFDTVAKTISRKGTHCKNPLIEIEDGQIQRATKK